MKFIKKQILVDGEELLYLPNLHWMYTVRQPVLFLLLIPLLLIVRAVVSYFVPIDLLNLRLILYGNFIQIILGIILVAFLILGCRIFLYWSIEYGITNRKLLMKKGIFRISTVEIPMDRIESIFCVQGLLGQAFNYGTIYISGIGGKMPAFYMVAKPFAVRRKIAEIVEKNKVITIIHGDLPKPKPVVRQVPEGEPAYRYGTFVRMLPDEQEKNEEQKGD